MEVPRGTSASRDAVSDEVGPHWNGSCQDDPEIVGVLNLVGNGAQKKTTREGGLREMATCADGEAAKTAGEGGFRGTAVCVGKETEHADESLEISEKKLQKKTAVQETLLDTEREDAQRPATFWEEPGPCMYEVRPQRDTGRRDTQDICKKEG
ncbi:hypothetical protein NDU88_000730 [Pleurodeles waltl]|uniref:Uncharacterized protein n=1 Tax=Pleurodeles waltl TaxID=8319 RepID=A0AAV7U528_PLEWA|nr:hypothetical protein NDU88_000730 [Pleurodeles waltl]